MKRKNKMINNQEATPNIIEKEVEVISNETKKKVLKKKHNIDVDYSKSYERTTPPLNKIKKQYDAEKVEAKQEISKHKEITPTTGNNHEQNRRNKEKTEQIEREYF